MFRYRSTLKQSGTTIHCGFGLNKSRRPGPKIRRLVKDTNTALLKASTGPFMVHQPGAQPRQKL